MKRKILLADDDPRLRTLVALTLGDDFILLHAADGEETLDIARREIPDLIFLDIMMPKVNGFEVCRRLKNDQSTAHIPVVMLTGRDSPEDIQQGKEAGADEYFLKPFSPRALLGKVTEILG
jgi:DNA-binding response OmpR family regulator